MEWSDGLVFFDINHSVWVFPIQDYWLRGDMSKGGKRVWEMFVVFVVVLQLFLLGCLFGW